VILADERECWSFVVTTRVRGTREQALACYDHMQRFVEGNAFDGCHDPLPDTIKVISSKVVPGDLTIDAYDDTR
jgi:hypothetical protein